MKRITIITLTATLATIAAGVLIRGDVAYGGEMIIPVLAAAYAIISQEEKDEKEPRTKRTARTSAKTEA